jgi:hypothetical protein
VGTPFANADQVLVAFRVLGSRKHEHWLNKVAVSLTARPGTKHGRMCHVELMMQTEPGVWYRFGIVKKSYVGSDEAGKPIFEWGSVHGKMVDQSSWDSKYIFLSLSVSRARQKTAFDFLTSQIGNRFNYWGYLLNLILPGGIGVGEYHPAMAAEPNEWYCSQLVGCALQAMGDESNLADVPHTPAGARHTYRVLATLAALVAGGVIGAFVGLLSKTQAGWGTSLAVLAGLSAGAVALLLSAAIISFCAAATSPRWKFYRSRPRHDWKNVMGRVRNLHQSSPNSLYDDLSGAKGVSRSRDPHGGSMLI